MFSQEDFQEGANSLEDATRAELLSIVEEQKREIRMKNFEMSEMRQQLDELRVRLYVLESCSSSTPVSTGTSVTITDSIPTRTTPNVTFCTNLSGSYMSTGATAKVKVPAGFGPVSGSSFDPKKTKEAYSKMPPKCSELPSKSKTSSRFRFDETSVSISSSVEEDTEDTSTEETDDGSSGVSNHRSEMQEMADLLVGRGAPKPEPYTLDPSRSFYRFLDSFEAYCSSRYSSKQKSLWTPELGRFLKGEALQVYRACGGPDQKYKYMKQKLQGWYDSAKVRISSSRKSQYENARPMDGEGLRIFATRLEHLYRNAYPNKSLDGKDLKRRLVDALPKSVVDGLERDLVLLRAANGQQNTWNDVLVLLEAQDEAARRGVGQGVVHSESRNVSSSHPWAGAQTAHMNMKVTTAGNKSNQIFFRPRSRSRHSKSPKSDLVCNWCKRPGHVFKDCRRRLNQCLRCGETGHFVRNCPIPGWNVNNSGEISGRRVSSSSSNSSGEGARKGRSRTRRHKSRTFRRGSVKKQPPLNSNPPV